jgi:ParB/RepB/Spo0J family partition protein
MNEEMSVVSMNIAEIKPYKKNAKNHLDKQIDQIIRSIEAFGFNQPIVIDKNCVIIVGHGRFIAAKKLGMKKVPVYIANLSNAKAKAYRLADNRLNESTWDMDLVIEEIKELDTEGFDTSLTGFDKDVLELDFNFQNTELSPENVPDENVKLQKCPNCGYDF